MEIIKSNDVGVIDRLSTSYPSILYSIKDENIVIPGHATAFGYIRTGEAVIDGQIIKAPRAFSALRSVYAKGDVVFTIRYGYRGQSVLGVAVEEFGRVQYIDGCTDSLLVYPARLGDPCLNSLHFPKGINQTFHTHPSIRAGVVASGRGFADTPTGTHVIEAGDAWLIDANEPHRFRTEDSEMIVIAYHPDSDWGPTDQAHPMLNRTYIK